MHHPPPNPRAFTLLELLLVVLLTGLVVSLLMPALSRARSSARDVASLANLRSHAGVLNAYSLDWNDYFPAFADPDATVSIVRGCGRTQHFGFYFESVVFWHIALCEGYYAESLEHGSLRHPARRPSDESDFEIDYFLSSAFYASPAYWNPTTRTGQDQWGPSKLTNVVFPSNKAIMVEIHPERGFPHRGVTEGIAMAFADGSADRFDADQLIEPYRNGGGWLPVGIYGMHTVDGWTGRDRK